MAGKGPRKETVQAVADKLFALLQDHPGGPGIRWNEQGSWNASYDREKNVIVYVVNIRHSGMFAIAVPMFCFTYDTPIEKKEAVYETIIDELVAWLLITRNVLKEQKPALGSYDADA